MALSLKKRGGEKGLKKTAGVQITKENNKSTEYIIKPGERSSKPGNILDHAKRVKVKMEIDEAKRSNLCY